MKINVKILIPLVVVIIVIVVAVALLTLPKQEGRETTPQEQQSSTTQPRPTTNETQTTVLELRITGVSVGYRDYQNPYDGEMISQGIRGFIELNITFEGYGTIKEIILELKNYGNITIKRTISAAYTMPFTERQRIQLQLNDTSTMILESLRNYKSRIHVIYETSSGERSIATFQVIPTDLSRRETTPIGR